MQHPQHPGIVALYQDNDPRDMRPEDVVRAIQNRIDADVPSAGQVIVLNHGR